MPNIIALVGRPNVGKSTLFNRLVGHRKAITDDVSGVTRDCHYGTSEWCGHWFNVIDTGGYVVGSEDVFESAIREQVTMALNDCTGMIFIVDAEVGLNGYDQAFVAVIRKMKKPVVIAANKIDTPNKVALANEFYALGMGDVYPISAENGGGTGDLLDALVSTFPSKGTAEVDEQVPRIAILGRPNVGKSSLVNALLGEETHMVTDQAGTTRDALHSRYRRYGKDYILIDTAGIRRKSKVMRGIELYAVARSIHALEESDVCLLMVDATEGLSAQDMHLISLAQRRGKAIALLMNKWDLVDKKTNTINTITKDMLRKLAPATYIPIIFVSALTKQRIFQAMEKVSQLHMYRCQKIATSLLNQTLLPLVEQYPPPMYKGKRLRIKYITQVGTAPPAFVFFCNLPQYIQKPYQRFLENKMRKAFVFEGVPIRLLFRKK